MGGGVSRVQSTGHHHYHAEPTVTGRLMEAFSHLNPLPSSSPPQKGRVRLHQKQKTREVQVRSRGFNDPFNKDQQQTPATSTSTLQRNSSENSQPEYSSNSDTKLIFSSMHSLPSFRSPAPNSNTNDMDDNASSVTFTLNPADSIRVRERQYWADGKNNASSIRASWNEVQLASLLSKPFSGRTKIMQSKSKNKAKGVRTVGVASPRDQK
eukprot:gene5261-5643_t